MSEITSRKEDTLIDPEQPAKLGTVVRLFRIRGIPFPEELFGDLLHETGYLPLSPDPLKQRRLLQFAQELEKSRLTELASRLFEELIHYDGLIEEIKKELQCRLPHVSNK